MIMGIGITQTFLYLEIVIIHSDDAPKNIGSGIFQVFSLKILKFFLKIFGVCWDHKSSPDQKSSKIFPKIYGSFNFFFTKNL